MQADRHADASAGAHDEAIAAGASAPHQLPAGDMQRATCDSPLCRGLRSATIV